MSIDLKPCPFCGSSATLEDSRLAWFVRCDGCGAVVMGDRAPEPEVEMPGEYWDFFRQSAMDRWNRRAVVAGDQADFRALCAELLSALVEYGNDIHYHEYHELIQGAETALGQPPAAESLSPREVEAQEAFTFRALCAELLPPLAEYDDANPYREHRALITRARSALAQPPAAGPTDEDIEDLADVFNGYPVPAIRRALELWIRPAAVPVPVSERLPGGADCCGNPRNGQGQWCWGRVRVMGPAETPVIWRLMRIDCLIDEAVEWLPWWALPLPQPRPPEQQP